MTHSYVVEIRKVVLVTFKRDADSDYPHFAEIDEAAREQLAQGMTYESHVKILTEHHESE